MIIDFVGDIHGDHSTLRSWVNQTKSDLVIQVGDFGIMPKIGYNLNLQLGYSTPTIFIEGNHDDVDYIEKMSLPEGITYQRRGSTKQIEDITFAFLGGGYSIDKIWRTEGVDWFPRECPSRREVEAFVEAGKNADVVVTHECPNRIAQEMFQVDQFLGSTGVDLDNILEHVPEFSPKLWVFGHWHPLNILKFSYRGIDFWCLPEYTGHRRQILSLDLEKIK
jgi:Icc-related predicted phosphoesterase